MPTRSSAAAISASLGNRPCRREKPHASESGPLVTSNAPLVSLVKPHRQLKQRKQPRLDRHRPRRRLPIDPQHLALRPIDRHLIFERLDEIERRESPLGASRPADRPRSCTSNSQAIARRRRLTSAPGVRPLQRIGRSRRRGGFGSSLPARADGAPPARRRRLDPAENLDDWDGPRCSSLHCNAAANATSRRSPALARLSAKPVYSTLWRPKCLARASTKRSRNSGPIAVTNEPIITASGLRGIVGQSLTPDVAWRYAAAFAKILPAGPVVVSRDGRANGKEFVAPITAGLIARRPADRARRRRCRHADHRRPRPAAPLRGRNPDLRQPQPGRIQRHETVLGRRARSCPTRSASECSPIIASSPGKRRPPKSRRPPSGSTTRPRPILALVEEMIDLARIRTRRFRVVLDANHGAGSALGASAARPIRLRRDAARRHARRQVRPPARADRRKSRQRAGRSHRQSRPDRFLPGPRRRPAGDHRRERPLPGRGIHARDLCRSCAPRDARPDRHQLLHQPDDRGRGPQIRRAVPSLGRRRGERGRRDARHATPSSAARGTAA